MLYPLYDFRVYSESSILCDYQVPVVVSALFNDAVSYGVYIVSVTGGWVWSSGENKGTRRKPVLLRVRPFGFRLCKQWWCCAETWTAVSAQAFSGFPLCLQDNARQRTGLNKLHLQSHPESALLPLLVCLRCGNKILFVMNVATATKIHFR
jgi:hypothetical protein